MVQVEMLYWLVLTFYKRETGAEIELYNAGDLKANWGRRKRRLL